MIEFVSIKKAAVVAALLGSAKPVSISNGDSYIPPPTPTKPATTPKTVLTGIPMIIIFTLQ